MKIGVINTVPIRTFTKTQCIDYCGAIMSQPLQIFTTHTYCTV